MQKHAKTIACIFVNFLSTVGVKFFYVPTFPLLNVTDSLHISRPGEKRSFQKFWVECFYDSVSCIEFTRSFCLDEQGIQRSPVVPVAWASLPPASDRAPALLLFSWVLLFSLNEFTVLPDLYVVE